MLFILVLLSSLVIGSIVRSIIQITKPELFFRVGSRRISIAYDLPGILLEVCLVYSVWLPYGLLQLRSRKRLFGSLLDFSLSALLNHLAL